MTNLKWIDITKGIGILLVIIGHTNLNQFLKIVIYTFHIPLFFFISGYLYHYDKYKQNTHSFITQKIKRLVVPYFITNLIILITFILLSLCGLYSDFNYNSPLKYLVGILYGNGAPLSPPTVYTNTIDISSWFLLSLFCASLVLYIIVYSHEKRGLYFSIFLSILFALFGFIISRYEFLPWSFDISCVSMIFMFSGYLINYYKIDWLDSNSKNGFYNFISILLLAIIISVNGSVDMNIRIYSNFLLFIVGGLLGACLTIEFAKIICVKENFLIKLLVFLGENSLIIFLYQFFTPTIFLNLINIFVPIKGFIYNSPILYTSIILIFLIITIFIIKKVPILNKIYYG